MNDNAHSPVDRCIDWFREASPYINSHRGSTLVLALPGTLLLRDKELDTLIQDIVLLHHLGLKLVVCFGLRAQIDAELGDESQIVDGRRVTDDHALSGMIEASGRARAMLEAKLSAALPNTPMAGSRVRLCSGNFVYAQPFGVRNGVDFQHTGAVRQVDAGALRTLLDLGHLVLLPPLGYSLTGEVFNLAHNDVAQATASALKAEKLVLFADQPIRNAQQEIVRETNIEQLSELLDSSRSRHAADPTEQTIDEELTFALACAARALEGGADRVHVLDPSNRNALLTELYTRDGDGTLITRARWEQVRKADINDVGGIIDLVKPLQEDGLLVTRSREALELDIDHFHIIERDGLVIACGALFFDDDGGAEIASIATHAHYRGDGRADLLMAHLERLAGAGGADHVRVLSTRTGHWFLARGYRETAIEALPEARQQRYDRHRNSKVFVKDLKRRAG